MTKKNPSKHDLFLMFQQALLEYKEIPSHGTCIGLEYKELNNKEIVALSYLRASLTVLKKYDMLVDGYEEILDITTRSIESEPIEE